jgi:hypothetical protein
MNNPTSMENTIVRTPEEDHAMFHRTVGIAVQAFLNDTLEHHNCHACMVGNMIAAANNFKFVRCVDETHRRFAWDVADGRYSKGGQWYLYLKCGVRDTAGLKQIESTGYSNNELNRIERAFESAAPGESDDEFMFNGLMSVVEALARIHKQDLSVVQEAKKLFVKA